MNNKIILKPIGGLGNQMFQAAYAYSVSEVFKDHQLELDLMAYETYKIRSFSLDNLLISNYYSICCEKNKKLELSSKTYRIYQKIIKKTQRTDVLGEKNFNFLKKKNMLYNFDRYFYPFSKEEIDKNNPIFIYGYFQSIKYFSDFEDDIKQKMRVKTLETNDEVKLIEIIKKSKYSVAISIRIGADYIESKELNVCNKSYFEKAIEKIEKIEKNRNETHFFIFSDDITKVKTEMKEMFDGRKVTFIEGFNDYQSLRLMYNCKDFIISNSSFSWWGAYLGNDDKKIVIAPNKWYNNSKKQPDIYYDKMILLDV